MKQTIKLFTLALTAIAITACTPSFRSNVTSFHEVPLTAGKTIAIIPMDEEMHGSIEFANYAALVGAALESRGYLQAGDKEPELIVGMSYTVNDGREKIRQAGISFNYWNHIGPYGSWAAYDPHMSGLNRLSLNTVYKIELKFEIRTPDGETLYETRADTETRDGRLTVIVPQLVEAIFSDFPGANGETRRVVLKREKE